MKILVFWKNFLYSCILLLKIIKEGEAMESLKVLFHVPDSSRFTACLRQANNLLATIKDEPYEIRVLVNFEGIKVVENFQPYEEMFKALILLRPLVSQQNWCLLLQR